MRFTWAIGLCVTLSVTTSVNCTNKKATADVRTRPLWSQTHLDKLKKDLLTNYDRYARPQEHNEATNVRVGMAILNVETDEARSSVILNAWIRLCWTDTKLQWNQSDYGGLPVMRISDHEIWQPDIYLYNSASGSSQLPRYGNVNLLIYPNGEVLWVPPVKLAALCDFDLRYWPFDVQKCYFKMGSWVYNGNEILLGLYSDTTAIELESTIGVSEWNVETSAELTIKKYDCCEEKYYSAFFNLTLSRKTSSYAAVIVAPTVVCTFFLLLQFWLPPGSGEKIFLNAFALIILNMFLVYLNGRVIGVGYRTPLIVLFYSRCLYVVTFTTASSVVMFCFSRTQKSNPLPRVLQKRLQSRLGHLMYLEINLKKFLPWKSGTENPELMIDHTCQMYQSADGGSSGGKPSVQQEWYILSVIMDRFLFLFCSVVFCVMGIVYC